MVNKLSLVQDVETQNQHFEGVPNIDILGEYEGGTVLRGAVVGAGDTIAVKLGGGSTGGVPVGFGDIALPEDYEGGVVVMGGAQGVKDTMATHRGVGRVTVAQQVQCREIVTWTPATLPDQAFGNNITDMDNTSGLENPGVDRVDVTTVEEDAVEEVTGLVPRLGSPLIAKLVDTYPSFTTLYHDSVQIYDQLGLISSKFVGQVVGPVCLYLDSDIGEETKAEMCLCDINHTFLMKVVVTRHQDLSFIKSHDTIHADVCYVLRNAPRTRCPVPLPIQFYQLDSLVVSHALAFNTIVSYVLRFFEVAESNSHDDNNFDTMDHLLGIDDMLEFGKSASAEDENASHLSG